MNLVARDKILTEHFIRNFVIAHSNIIFAIVGELTLSDQKLFESNNPRLETQ